VNVKQFFLESHIFIVTGKGGTGKTVSSIALAMTAAGQGLNTLLVTLDEDSHIFELLNVEISNTEASVRIEENLSVRLITPEDALIRYLVEHGMGKVSKRLLSTNTVHVISNAIPGIEEILVLGRLKQLEKDKIADVIIVDGPATGHAITLLTSPKGLAFVARGGALRKQADDVEEMLSDHKRCQVVFVCIPEETPINETVDAAYLIEDKTNVALAPMIINQVYTSIKGIDTDPKAAAEKAGLESQDQNCLQILKDASEFRRNRIEFQRDLLERLQQELALPKIYLPLILAGDFTENMIFVMAEILEQQISTMKPFDHAS
jgi:anion-transporting  ArsA/GET3 family ATPase